MRPDLRCLAVRCVDDMDKVELDLLACPCGVDGREHNRMVTAYQDIMPLRLDAAPRQLGDHAKMRHHLVRALVVAGERASAGDVPFDVAIEELVLQGAQV